MIREQINNRIYDLFLNGKTLKIKVRRIKKFRDYYDSLVTESEVRTDVAYFIYNEPNFGSFGLSMKLDLVWVDFNGKITHIEENFTMNSVTKSINETKYIYLFSAGAIKKNNILLNDVLTHRYKRKKHEWLLFN